MAYAHSKHFTHFFGRVNPSSSFEQRASSEYNTIKGLLEARQGPAAILSPVCFLQGSYRRQTAIYSINDIDIIVLCRLWHPPAPGSGSGRGYGRDEIFSIIAAPLLADQRYRSKVSYGPQSMCIEVDLGIKVEILPVVYKAGNNDPDQEPFRLYRPQTGNWEDGFARYHQAWLSDKNSAARTQGNFIPMIKVLKHLRSKSEIPVVSFFLECLLYAVPDYCYWGGPADYIHAVLQHIASRSPDDWYGQRLNTPSGDRDIFTGSEWTLDSWRQFHPFVPVWVDFARIANEWTDRDKSVEVWQQLLGGDYFPASVS